MITLNYDNLLGLIVVLSMINAFANILLGISETPKNTKYGITNILNGIITIILLTYFVFMG